MFQVAINILNTVTAYIGDDLILGIIPADKIAHATLIFFIGLFLRIFTKNIYIITIILVIIGIGKEFLDKYIRMTFFSTGDLIADGVGITLFIIVCILLFNKKK